MELVEGLGELVGHDFLAVYFDSRKEALVEQAAFLGASLDVGPLDVVGHGQCQVKGLHDLLVLNVQAVDALLGSDPLAPDALLLLGEQAVADLIGIVGLQQLSLLLFELRQP